VTADVNIKTLPAPAWRAFGLTVMVLVGGSLLFHYINAPGHFARGDDHIRHLLLPHSFVILVWGVATWVSAAGWSRARAANRAATARDIGVGWQAIAGALCIWPLYTISKAGYDLAAVGLADSLGYLVWTAFVWWVLLTAAALWRRRVGRSAQSATEHTRDAG
jgi:hypothetical protein